MVRMPLTWTVVTPIWLTISLLRLSAHAMERMRFAASLPSLRTAVLQGLLLCPLAIAGCGLMLRRLQRGAIVSPAVLAAAALLALLAWPAYGLAALLLASGADLSHWYAAVHARGTEFWYPWLSNGIDYCVCYALCAALVFALAARRHEAAERAGRIRAEARAACERQRTLRAQINPHFLFNALNTLVAMNKAGAAHPQPDLMTELAQLLRQTTVASEREQHTLQEEMRHVAGYLKIQGVRHPRLQTQIDIGAGCAELLVPTLVLMSLVENAVTHGLRGGAAVDICVQAVCGAGGVLIVVRNTVADSPESDTLRQQGTGLRMIRERLALLFGGAAGLRVGRPDAEHFQATLMLPRQCRTPLSEERSNS